MNKTKKKNNSASIRNKSTVDNYNNFIMQHPKSLPKTRIVKYMDETYQNYIDKKKQNIENSKLHDFFIIPDNLKTKLYSDSDTLSLNITINNNPNMNLDKLICYLMFTFPNMFKTGSVNMEEFKYQVGKDYHRINVLINNKPLPEEVCPRSGIETSQYNQIVDNLNRYMMEIMVQNNIPVKMNIIIKINALLMQSVFNVMVNLFVSILLSKQIIIKNGIKNVNIVLNSSNQYMRFSYKAPLINLESLCECGTFSFNLKTNFLTNSFLMDVKLSYDITKCFDTSELSGKKNTVDSSNNLDKITEYSKVAYNFANNNQPQIAAAITTTGLATVGTILFAGLLGGKTLSKRKIKLKRQKNKRTKKYYSKKQYKNNSKNLQK